MTRLRKLAALGGLTYLAFALPARAEEDTLPWLDNYKEALREARSTQKPIFLEFRCEP